MTTELTKAAQQALERLKIHRSSNYCNACEAEDEEAISALERALTTSRPAQAGEVDEREAFEARVVAEAGEGAIAKWLGTDGYENTRVQDYRLGWVWCLEWQARASLPAQPAAQATPDVPETDFGNMATQQATPEPVGDVAGVFARDKYDVWHMLPPGSTRGTTLYTRPAPGVPEGFADLLDEVECFLRTLRNYDGNPVPINKKSAMIRAIQRAAAQAKGDAHE